MNRIMITGASGQLGLALYRLLKDKPEFELLRTDTFDNEDGTVQKLDITDEEAVKNYMQANQPQIIINCAAMTAVDLCESEPERAYRINALGPRYLAVAAEGIHAKLVHISTDYVFDGEGSVPYTEENEPNPVSVYGSTKQAGDAFVQEFCSRFFILRTAWVFGEGKNFVKTMLRLAQNKNQIRVVYDQVGTPTSALELARVILFLMVTESYGIYHATCEGSTNWYEFAKTIFDLAGISSEVEAIPTSEYPTPARRPKYSILENRALYDKHGYMMKHWKDALMEYMSD